MSESIALLTAGTEVMPNNASRIARGLRSVTLNLQGMDDAGNEVLDLLPKMEKDFNKIGITLKDETTGQLKSTFQIFSDLSEKMPELDKDTQNYYASLIGGKNNVDVVNSVLLNFQTAIEANETAMNSSGSAMRELSAAQEGLSFKMNLLKASFQELVLGNGGLGDFIKQVIDGGTAILRFANTDIGQLIIKIGALTLAFTLLNKTVQSTRFNTLTDNVSKFILAISSAEGKIGKFSAGLKALNISPIALGVTALTTAIVLGKKAYDSYRTTVEETKESIQNLKTETGGLESSFDGIVDSLDNLTEEQKEYIKEIDLGNEDYLKTYDELITKNEDIIDSEKDKLELLKAQIEANNQLIEQEYKKEAKARSKGERRYSDLPEYTGTAPKDEYAEATGEQSIYEIKALSLDTEKATINDLAVAYQVLQDTKATSLEQDEEIKDKTNAIISALTQEGLNLTQLKEDGIALTESDKELLDIIQDITGSFNSNTEAIQENSEQQVEIAENQQKQAQLTEEELQKQEELTKEINKAYEDAVSGVTGLDDAYSSLTNAVNEYNSTGTFSLDTLDNLLSMGSEYLALLDFEDGQLSLNEEGLYALANARIDQAEATAIQKAQNDLLTASNYDLSSSESTAGNVANDSVTGFNNASTAISDLAQQAINGAISVQQLMKAFGSDTTEIVVDSSTTQSLLNQLKLLENLRANIGKNITATGNSTKSHDKNTGSRKRNADATKAQTSALKAHKKALEDERDALEDEIDEMEEIIDYMGELLERDKKAVEDERDAVLEAIDDKIEWLEKQKQKEHDIFQESIDIREKRKKEIEDYWDAEIEKVKQGNQVVEKNIELQKKQEALARAKTQKVKVLKDGKFVYQQDEEAVSKAEQELADYEMELSINQHISEMEQKKRDALAQIDEEIKVLKQSQEDTDNIYDQEIKDLQDLRAEKEAEYEARIDQFATYEAIYEGMLNRAKEDHMKILLEETGLEQGNWTTRLNNLATFIESYEGKKKSLDDIKDEIETVDSQIQKIEQASKDAQSSVNAISQDMQNTLSKIQDYKNQAEALKPKTVKYQGVVYDGSGKIVFEGNHRATSGEAHNDAYEWYYAHPTLPNKTIIVSPIPEYNVGTYSMDKDQIALVGDPKNPSNREMVVGANINSGKGIMGSFDKGTGIIPSGQNFTESLVRLGRWENSGGIQKIMNNNSSSSQVSSIHIDNINLPNVKNPQDFVDYLENNFMNDAIQYASIRG